MPGDAVPSPADPAEFLDVDLDELAGAATLLAGGRLGGSICDSLPSPMGPKTAETVDSGIARHKAISAPVIRNRRSAAMTSTRAWLVRCGMRPGAEERSKSPASPSAR